MSDWSVKLCVAIIAASAAILAAFVGLWKDRKSRRDVILQDFQILDKLPAASVNHAALKQYLDRRVLFLAVEDDIGAFFYLFAAIIVVVVLGLLAGAIAAIFFHNFRLSGILGALLLTVMVGFPFSYHRLRSKTTEFVSDTINESVRMELARDVRQNAGEVFAQMRKVVIQIIEREIPEEDRTEVIDRLGPVVDQKIDREIAKLLDGLLSGHASPAQDTPVSVEPNSTDESEHTEPS
jgi:hypothetical protein